MHALKLVLLVAVTVTVMRSVSWSIAWPLMRRRSANRRVISVSSNAAGLLLFLAYLHWDRLPGEFLDWSAALFGAVVYALFTLADLLWHPCNRKTAAAKGTIAKAPSTVDPGS